MANYRDLLSGLLLAVALVNCYALPADLDVSASQALPVGLDASAQEALPADLDTPELEDSTSETESEVADVMDEYAAAETDHVVDLEHTFTGDEPEETQSESEVVTDANASNNEESPSAESGSAAIDDNSHDASGAKQTVYIMSTISYGQDNMLNVTGGEIKESIKVPGYMSIRTFMLDNKMVVPHIVYSDSNNTLVLLDGKNCVERTYSAGAAIGERNMTTDECRRVIADMHRVERQAEEVARRLANPFANRPFRPHHPFPRRGGRRHRFPGNRLGRLRLPASAPAPNAQSQSSV